MKSTLALNPLVHKLQHSNMNRGKLYSSLFQINEITTWPNGVENNMSDRPSATLTLDLLHPGCCYTMGIYCNICLSGLNMSDCFEVSCQKGFLWPTPALCDFDLLPREPQSWSRQALPRALFVPTGIKIGSFSITFTSLVKDKQMDRCMDNKDNAPPASLDLWRHSMCIHEP